MNFLEKKWFLGVEIAVVVGLVGVILYFLFWNKVSICSVGDKEGFVWRKVGDYCFFQVDGKVNEVGEGGMKIGWMGGEIDLSTNGVTKYQQYRLVDENPKIQTVALGDLGELVDREVSILGVKNKGKFVAIRVVQYLTGADNRLYLLDALGAKQ